jgi:hypothetical protein
VLAADAVHIRGCSEVQLGLDADVDGSLGFHRIPREHLRIEQRAWMRGVDRDLTRIEPVGKLESGHHHRQLASAIRTHSVVAALQSKSLGVAAPRFPDSILIMFLVLVTQEALWASFPLRHRFRMAHAQKRSACSRRCKRSREHAHLGRILQLR